MAEVVGDVTAKELQEHFDKSLKCEAVTSFDITIYGWTYKREHPCRRRARHMVVVTCAPHGAVRRPICARHLQMLRSGIGTLFCSQCNQPAVWVA